MSSLSSLNSEPSFLAILNLLCPHYLWTDRFLDLLPFVPSECSPFWTPKAIQSISKFELSHCGFTKTLKGVLLTLKKRQNLGQLFNRSERCLTCRHLQKIRHRQADVQFLPIPEGQIRDLDSTDPMKQAVSQGCLRRDLSRPKMLS